ncbi:hypothetical protein APD12_14445 [Acinetobacter pittii]|nr:hypothetical protein APD12_14445 [Acinetobacter pittii]OCZ47502.1 hypothetical protein BFR73_09505 [Acinetobacter pittii]OTS00596.1 hypothetical protein CAT25_06935 [Acinetobacter pittii]RSO28576.1 hypothetical protein EA761_07845 [Acinetobacter pittii]
MVLNLIHNANQNIKAYFTVLFIFNNLSCFKKVGQILQNDWPTFADWNKMLITHFANLKLSL